jgi:hypothetical protein
VGIFAISGLMGVVFLYQGMKVVSDASSEGANTRKWVIIMWMFAYAFVGSQMAWTFRPFVGAPGVEFELFRSWVETSIPTSSTASVICSASNCRNSSPYL